MTISKHYRCIINQSKQEYFYIFDHMKADLRVIVIFR